MKGWVGLDDYDVRNGNDGDSEMKLSARHATLLSAYIADSKGQRIDAYPTAYKV